ETTGNSFRRIVDGDDPGITAGVLCELLACAVGAHAVGHDNFPIEALKIEIEERVEENADVFRFVSARGDNGNSSRLYSRRRSARNRRSDGPAHRHGHTGCLDAVGVASTRSSRLRLGWGVTADETLNDCPWPALRRSRSHCGVIADQ